MVIFKIILEVFSNRKLTKLEFLEVFENTFRNYFSKKYFESVFEYDIFFKELASETFRSKPEIILRIRWSSKVIIFV